MASYLDGKQKRSKTRKEEAEAGKATARKFYTAVAARHHPSAENQLVFFPGKAKTSPGMPI
jgi:hypothetical protein